MNHFQVSLPHSAADSPEQVPVLGFIALLNRFMQKYPACADKRLASNNIARTLLCVDFIELSHLGGYPYHQDLRQTRLTHCNLPICLIIQYVFSGSLIHQSHSP